MIPLPFVNSENWLRSRLISRITHLTYTCVSGRFIFAFERFAVDGPFVSSVFVTSRQSRYIIYGSSNLTLKKNEDPGAYGDALASFPGLDGGSET